MSPQFNAQFFPLGVLLTFIFFAPVNGVCQSVNTPNREVVKLSDQIYVIHHKDSPDGYPQGNTTVIIGEKEVLVFDAPYLLSSAREDIQQIKSWTTKPVSYLVNSHWHPDHVMSNAAYRDAFPAIKIIAHKETSMAIEGYVGGYLKRYPSRREEFKKIIESGKDPSGNVLSETDLKDYRDAMNGMEPVYSEFKSLTLALPNMEIQDDLILNLGSLEVQLLFLGWGETAGDLLAYLPQQKIILTGDVVSYPVPYMGGKPTSKVELLKSILELQATTYVPGHGKVLNATEGNSFVTDMIVLSKEIIRLVSAESYKAGPGLRRLDQVKEVVKSQIDIKKWETRFAGTAPENVSFFNLYSIDAPISAVFLEFCNR